VGCPTLGDKNAFRSDFNSRLRL